MSGSFSCIKPQIETPQSTSPQSSAAKTMLSGNEISNLDVLNFSVVTSIYEELVNKYGESALSSGNIEQDEALLNILSPLINNGKSIHTNLLNHIKNDSEWQNFTSDEQNTIMNFNDRQYAMLAIIYATENAIHNGYFNDNNNTAQATEIVDHIVDCLGAALGLTELYYLVVQNPRALMTARGAAKILKHVGLRYLGYIGLALAVYDFIDCID